MGNFKQQFNHAFQEAPTFSTKARQHVKSQLHHKKKKRWMPISILAAAAVALVSFVIWNDELIERFNKQDSINLAAPEHEGKMEIFLEVPPDNETQFAITNDMNSMNRGNGEYKGTITIETQFNEIQYGQVLLLEEGMEGDVFRYVLGRVIGKPGDKVAIKEGQLYLNDLPINTFYGKAQIMGTTDVEEAFERLRGVSSAEWKETIEEALHYSLEPIVLKEDELFIVSDSWARNSVRQTFTIDQIEGIVIGYTDVVRNGTENVRKLNEEELRQFKEMREQLISRIKIQNQNPNKIEIDNPDHLSDNIVDHINPDYLSDNIVDHQIKYKKNAVGNSVLLFEKFVEIAYYHTELGKNIYFDYALIDGKWTYLMWYEK